MKGFVPDCKSVFGHSNELESDRARFILPRQQHNFHYFSAIMKLVLHLIVMATAMEEMGIMKASCSVHTVTAMEKNGRFI